MNWAWNSKVILFFKKNSELTSSSRLPSFTETSLVAVFFRWMVNWGRKQENQRSPGDSWIFFWRAWRLGGKNTVLHWVSVYWHWSVQLDPSHGNNNFRRKKRHIVIYAEPGNAIARMHIDWFYFVFCCLYHSGSQYIFFVCFSVR